MRFGMQLFGINPVFNENKTAFMERIRKAGIRYLEPCLTLKEISDDSLRSHVWNEAQLMENVEAMKEYGFSVFSCHAFTENMIQDAPEFIRICKEVGITQLVLNAVGYENEDQFAAAAKYYKEAALILKKEGIELLLHNTKESGKEYDVLLEMCGSEVGAQPDLGWLLYAGIDPEEFLWRKGDQIRSVHYKDMKETENGLTETVTGQGILDTDSCFQFARMQEIIQLIDQDAAMTDDFIGDIEKAIGQVKRSCWSHGKSRSYLCILDTETGELRKLHEFDHTMEAPNWHQQNPDLLYYNDHGSIYKYSISRDEITEIKMSCSDCNNDHVLSPDGTMIAVSAENPSQIFIAPIEGGEARQITSMGPSYLHGWSVKDELCYCAFRTQDGKESRGGSTPVFVDVYRISAEGGDEERLTDQKGYNDGCEYSPDGEFIWYCSTRNGYMQVFRMRRDGSEVTQMTYTEENNWFGHISPNGEKVAYLTFSKEGLDPDEHLPNLYCKIGIMNADGSDPHTVLKFFGGQGSINVNSWSPDNRHLALVVYELIHK